MHIFVINPTITARWNEKSHKLFTQAAQPDTTITVRSLDWGTASIECQRDVALVVPELLNKAMQAEQEGADAIIIECMEDPGLEAARELVRIPVVGPAQASMHLAAILGHRFSVVTTSEGDIPAVENLAIRYGLAAKLASVRALNIPVLALEEDARQTTQALIEAGVRAVQEDGAHVIIPGCTELAEMVGAAQAALEAQGCPVPVLNPPAVATKLAESLVYLGLTHSKHTYPAPPAKTIRWPVENIWKGETA